MGKSQMGELGVKEMGGQRGGEGPMKSKGVGVF